MFGRFEEFNKGLDELRKEEWISFRTHYYKFEEYLVQWYDQIKTEETTTMTVRLQQEIDKYKVLLSKISIFSII